MNGDGRTMCGATSDGARDLGQERLAAAWTARETVGRVGRQLERVRTLMYRLDPATLGITTDRYEAVLLGYDTYVCMLVEALAEAVDALSESSGGGDPCGVAGRGGRVDRAEVAARRDRGTGPTPLAGVDAIGDLAGAVRGELRWLRAVLVRVEERIEDRIEPDAALTDDWRIAEQGLFGAGGVLDLLGVIPAVGAARVTVVDGPRWSTSDGMWTRTSDAA